jgi:hypothetical protein
MGVACKGVLLVIILPIGPFLLHVTTNFLELRVVQATQAAEAQLVSV